MVEDDGKKSLEEQPGEIGLSTLAAAQQQFLKRWGQYEPRHQQDFERDLYYLIGLASREAQAPLLRHLSEMAGLRAVDKP